MPINYFVLKEQLYSEVFQIGVWDSHKRMLTLWDPIYNNEREKERINLHPNYV